MNAEQISVSIRNKMTKKRIVVTLLAIAVAGSGYWYFFIRDTAGSAIRYSVSAAIRGTLVSSISGTGQISASTTLEVKSQSSGNVSEVDVKAGQNVKAGQRIAALDSKSAQTSVIQARASLLSAQANLQKLREGLSGIDLELNQMTLDQARASVEEAKASYENAIKEQEQSVKTALSNYLNSGLSALKTVSFDSGATLNVSGGYTGTEEGEYRIILLPTGTGSFTYSVTGLERDSGSVVRNLPIPIGSRGLYMTFSTAGTFSEIDSWTISVPNKRASNYLSTYNTYQTSLQNQEEALDNAKKAVETAERQLRTAELQFQQKQEPATTAEITSAEAQVAQARAQLQSAEDAYSNTVFVAPFDGKIADVNVSVGDSAGSNTVIATLITPKQVAEITLNEVDISKVKVGQKATLTFSAVEDLTLTGTVGEIDTLGTVAQGVVNYNVKVALDSEDERIKPAMSASVSIITDSKSDVVMVPNSAVKTQGGGSYVLVFDSSQLPQSFVDGATITPESTPKSMTVETGLTNDDYTEIVSGLEEGERVVTQTLNSSTTSKSTGTSGTTTGLGGGGTMMPAIMGGGR